MILAILIFLLVYLALAIERFPRHWVTMIGGLALVATGILTPVDAFKSINWETLGLLSGMFLLVAILTEAGFFTRLAVTAIQWVNYRPAFLFIILVVLAAGMAMFIDSITVMMFLAALSVQFCRLLKLDPVPLIIAEVCAANTGGAATLVGDPPNVILGTVLGFNFSDFAANTGPISAVACILFVAYFYLINRKHLLSADGRITPEVRNEMDANSSSPIDPRLVRTGLLAFGAAVLLLVFHRDLSNLTGLGINTAICALFPAGFACLTLEPRVRKTVLRAVDFRNLLFFTGLFILVGGLEKTDVFESLANGLSGLSNLDESGWVMALHWGPGLLSGIVDNVPMALAMSYLLKDLAQSSGMPALALMVWSLALGIDIGGNLTPIGASANVVAYTYIEQNHGPVGWKRWILTAAPPTLLVMSIVSGLVVLKGVVGWY